MNRTAINPTRAENYPEWYQEVIKAAELADNSSVRGCMVIRPWGYGLWENIQRIFDAQIKRLGHENAYFPLFIPLSYLEKEAEHVEGFAKECAVVTHHRLEEKDGKLIPTGKLEEPLVVRPTSETIIGESFSKWINSYRDLPLLINQWANVVRWEMRPRLFLRTAEFLWQEGHTAHATEEEALEEVLTILELYKNFVQDYLAIPVLTGEKPPSERFPGATNTYCIEAMMQDGKALQAGTSHYLGQSFSKASNIKFLNKEGVSTYAYTSSWGVSTRLIGGLIMTHSDDDGMRIPPKIATKHVVLIPVCPKKEQEPEIFGFLDKLEKEISQLEFNGEKIRVVNDKKDIKAGEKKWAWVKKGIPIRIEVGPRDLEKNQAVLSRRDKEVKEKEFLGVTELLKKLPETLEEIQNNYFREAQEFQETNTKSDFKDKEELISFFKKESKKDSKIFGSGFAEIFWSGDESEILSLLKENKLSIRCVNKVKDSGSCIFSGAETYQKAIIAKSY